jgi:hypothetical protein
MADYGAAGVWNHDGNLLDPARLPLNPKLRARLARWSIVYFDEAAARANYQGTPASYETEIL